MSKSVADIQHPRRYARRVLEKMAVRLAGAGLECETFNADAVLAYTPTVARELADLRVAVNAKFDEALTAYRVPLRQVDKLQTQLGQVRHSRNPS